MITKNDLSKKANFGHNGYGFYCYQDYDTYRKVVNALKRLLPHFTLSPPTKITIKPHLFYFRLSIYHKFKI